MTTVPSTSTRTAPTTLELDLPPFLPYLRLGYQDVHPSWGTERGRLIPEPIRRIQIVNRTFGVDERVSRRGEELCLGIDHPSIVTPHLEIAWDDEIERWVLRALGPDAPVQIRATGGTCWEPLVPNRPLARRELLELLLGLDSRRNPHITVATGHRPSSKSLYW